MSESDPPTPSPQPNVRAGRGLPSFSVHFWILVIVVGVLAGLGTAGLRELLITVEHLAWSYHSGSFLEGVRHASWQRRVEVLAAAGLLAGSARLLLRMGGGGHAGEVTEAIWLGGARLPLARTLARAVVSITVVGMGIALGREGAAKQTGAAIASALADRVHLSQKERRLLVVCGTGAGFGAIYNVPFGGALFAAEILLGTLALPELLPILGAALVATAVAWIVVPTGPTYQIPTSAYTLSMSQVGFALVAGPVAGLAAVAYVRLIGWADRRRPKGVSALLAPVVAGSALGAAAIAFPELLGNGKSVVQLGLAGQMSLGLLAVLVVLRPLATASSLASGAPGGLFTPTLAVGALLGGLLGQGWALLWPGTSPGVAALIGAGAVLAAANQGPISAIVLVLELTQHIDGLAVPVMLGVTGASLVTRRLTAQSVYTIRLHAAPAPASPIGEKGTLPRAA